MFGSKKKKAETVVQETLAVVPVFKPVDDHALVAVIAAAIAVTLGTSVNGIVIKSIKRTGHNLPDWGARGRLEQISNRF